MLSDPSFIELLLETLISLEQNSKDFTEQGKAGPGKAKGAVSSRATCTGLSLGRTSMWGWEGVIVIRLLLTHLLSSPVIPCPTPRPYMTMFPARMTCNPCWPGLRSWRKPTSTWSGRGVVEGCPRASSQAPCSAGQMGGTGARSWRRVVASPCRVCYRPALVVTSHRAGWCDPRQPEPVPSSPSSYERALRSNQVGREHHTRAPRVPEFRPGSCQPSRRVLCTCFPSQMTSSTFCDFTPLPTWVNGPLIWGS